MFVAGKHPNLRFSLLLLEENEYYIRDFVATCCWPQNVGGNVLGLQEVSGQLRLCSRSIFFDADDVRVPIVRLPFVHVEGLEGVGWSGLAISTASWTTMKRNADDAPYVFTKGLSACWQFTLTYASLGEFMSLAQNMLIASRMQSAAEQETMLQEFLLQREAASKFQLSHIRSVSTESNEQVFNVTALSISPLVREPVHFVVTAQRLYVQPVHIVGGFSAVKSHPLSSIAAIARRRSTLKDVGLEIFFFESSENYHSSYSVAGPQWDTPSGFFAFRTREDRESALQAITKQTTFASALPGGRCIAEASASILEAGGGWLPRVTLAWQRGLLSNFDYLLYCNLAAGRSFNDLTQYPVFPWVVADYTSTELRLDDPGVYRDLRKPVGALNPSRLDAFRARYRHMEEAQTKDDSLGRVPMREEPFLYGTHYSCPGYTLFWLVRVAPAHMLRLQNGRFDAPDRLFTSVAEAWDSVLTNPTDVKELIPEFFIPGMEPFLTNTRRLALGKRQDGRAVGDVLLPPWANGSAKKFIELNRAALESPIVSSILHHWIDLIFGHKQRGAAAVEADNVFRSLTYEGVVDIDSISDPVERAAAEMAINEFGQCPRQIFQQPHPPRSAIVLTRMEGDRDANQPPLYDCSVPLHRQKTDLTAVIISTIMAATEISPSSPMSHHTPKRFLTMADFLPRLTVKGSWNPSDSYSKTPAGLTASTGASVVNATHAINAVAVAVPAGGDVDTGTVWTAYAVDQDGCLRVYELEGMDILMTKNNTYDGSQQRSERRIRVAQQPLSSICVLDVMSNQVTVTNETTNNMALVFCGSYDGHVYVYDSSRGQHLGHFLAHEDAVSCMTAVHVGEDNQYVITASWDRTCKVWSLNNGAGQAPAIGQERRQNVNPLWKIDQPFPVHILQLQGGAWSLSAKVSTLKVESGSLQDCEPSAVVVIITVGTEDGEVVGAEFVPCCSTRTSCVAQQSKPCEPLLVPRWNLALSDDYVGGVAVIVLNTLESNSLKVDQSERSKERCIGHQYRVVAAFADGRLMLIDPDMKQGPGCVSSISCGTPLRCCIADPSIALAGTESGNVVVWNVAQQLGLRSSLVSTSCAPDVRGMHAPLTMDTGCPINSIAVGMVNARSSAMCLVAGDEYGCFQAWGGCGGEGEGREKGGKGVLDKSRLS